MNNNTTTLVFCVGLLIELNTGASPGFGRGGQEFFFLDLGICMSRSDMLRMEAMRIDRGVRGHAPPRNFFKTVQFGAF